MLNVDFSINPLTNRRQIAVNGAEERLSECCGSRDIPLEEWKGNCFEVLAKKYNDDVLSVLFTGMAKDFRFLSYLKNGAETEKKLQITLTEKTVYEPEKLYRELGEAIREYNASEYDFLHEEYRKITGGMTEIVFLTPEAGWTSDRLKPLLYDSDKNEYYAERKVTVVDAATADSLPEPEHALYYIHLCDLDGTAFKKSKQYLEKIRSLLSSRSRRTLPDTFFLCEYDFESEEYEDLCDRIDSVLKENTVPLLPFNRESVSEEVKKTTETFFGDYVFGGCLLGYFTQINDSLSKPIRKNASEVEKLKEEIEAAEKELRDLQEQREALRKEKEQYREIPKILDREVFEDQLQSYLFRYPELSNCAQCIVYKKYGHSGENDGHTKDIDSFFKHIDLDDSDRTWYFYTKLRKFFRLRDYSKLQSMTKIKINEDFILDFFDQWLTPERKSCFLNHERFFFENDIVMQIYNDEEWERRQWWGYSEYLRHHKTQVPKLHNLIIDRYPYLMHDVLLFLDDLELYVLERSGYKRKTDKTESFFANEEKKNHAREASILAKIKTLEDGIKKALLTEERWQSILLQISKLVLYLNQEKGVVHAEC